MNENIDMRIMEKVSRVIRPWFRIFLSWPPISFRTWFGVWFIAYDHVFFTSMGEFLVVDRMYRSSYVILIRSMMVCVIGVCDRWSRFTSDCRGYEFRTLSLLCKKRFFVMIVLCSSRFQLRLGSLVGLWCDM